MPGVWDLALIYCCCCCSHCCIVVATTVVVVVVVVVVVTTVAVAAATAVAGGGGLGHLGRWFGGSQMMGSTFAVLTTPPQGRSTESGVFEETLLPIFAAPALSFFSELPNLTKDLQSIFFFHLALAASTALAATMASVALTASGSSVAMTALAAPL
jgi:hypothetical protein